MRSRFQFVDDHRDGFEVKWLCQVLEVNRSSYYKWRAGRVARAARQRADHRLAARIREVHDESRGAYGSPRVTAELRDQGLRGNEKRVARVMRTFSITGIRLRRRVRTTIPDPAASQVPDLFQRDFTAGGPGSKYMGDITYLPLANGGFLYLATVLDCFSRKVVGWSIADHMRTGLVADALRMAAHTRGGLEGSVFHSDHGAQYGSRAYHAGSFWRLSRRSVAAEDGCTVVGPPGEWVGGVLWWKECLHGRRGQGQDQAYHHIAP